MKVTILDTVTGLTDTVEGVSPFEWAEGNYSCDCNRNLRDVDTGKPDGFCKGSERFLVVAADDNLYSLREYNEDYPEELLNQFLPT